MKKKATLFKKLDLAGMILSGLCALHCSLIPLIILLGMGTGLRWVMSHEIEMTFLFVSFAIASLSLIYGYFRFHRRAVVILLAILGFVFFVIGHEFLPFLPKIILTSFGGVCILFAHYLNLKFRSLSYTLAIKR